MHTESQVIHTSGTVHWYNMTKWAKQRDKNVWVALRVELKRWENMVNFYHVESHNDKKKDEQGNKRKVTSLNMDVNRSSSMFPHFIMYSNGLVITPVHTGWFLPNLSRCS